MKSLIPAKTYFDLGIASANMAIASTMDGPVDFSDYEDLKNILDTLQIPIADYEENFKISNYADYFVEPDSNQKKGLYRSAYTATLFLLETQDKSLAEVLFFSSLKEAKIKKTIGSKYIKEIKVAKDFEKLIVFGKFVEDVNMYLGDRLC